MAGREGRRHFSLRRLFGSSSSLLSRHTLGRSSRPDAEGRPHDTRRGPLAKESSWGSAHRSLDSGSLWSCSDGGRLECPLCLLELPTECFPQLSSCSHRACCDCLRQYLRIEISESRVNISCPECTEAIHPNDIRALLQDEVMTCKYETFMLRRVLVTEADARWCPAPDCGYVVIATGCASCPKLVCERPGCGTAFCYHCKQEWHPNQTCDAARAQRAPPQDSSGLQRDDIKHCPRCMVYIIKMDDGSCNHMTCRLCGTEFCWLCMKEISDLHYLSPSGCTFWGKKPWSRKKKILWQLGMLVGAPVGIALIAGIAVPAIIIGIPVWVGRKLHAKYDLQTPLKRNLAMVGGVVASFLVSPIIAGIAVGIGVPILLAYVYGVVPVSLCRSGGCGVTTSASGVRIEFDEDVVADWGGEQALSRIGAAATITASNTAIAGNSLTGSITSNKLEVQVDVTSGKRLSMSSETASATASYSERSANAFLVADDNASTRALAGSIIGYREGTTPVEVHVSPEEDYCKQCLDNASVTKFLSHLGGDWPPLSPLI
ncbi:E3 ubiquitin-protein ligase RNF19A-like [Ornithodoros turicata]|uniref:E3 ubiquitin-protein ligase RNF19A-like n=1 Tax=Ornithodoros turicata TaxID=34597 RepID=UPI003138BBFD